MEQYPNVISKTFTGTFKYQNSEKLWWKLTGELNADGLMKLFPEWKKSEWKKVLTEQF